MRSAYHIRNVEVFRLKQLAADPPQVAEMKFAQRSSLFFHQVLMSHDWPRGITKFGNEERLLRFKKHFRDEVAEDRLGSGPTREVFPRY